MPVMACKSLSLFMSAYTVRLCCSGLAADKIARVDKIMNSGVKHGESSLARATVPFDL